MHFSFPLVSMVMVPLDWWPFSEGSLKVALDLKLLRVLSASAAREYSTARWDEDRDVRQKRIQK